MSYYSARTKFEEAENSSQNPAITAIAEGLKELAQAIENDINKLERDIHAIKNKVNSMR
jgi:archaellum component FlaC